MIEWLYILAYYWLAAFSIAIYRQWLHGKLSLTNKIAFCIPLMVFYVSDILLNYTVFWVMGPPVGATITDRMSYYKNKDTGIRGSIGRFLCKLLDEVDPSGAHCE